MFETSLRRVRSRIRSAAGLLAEGGRGIQLASRRAPWVPYIGAFIPNLGDVALYQAIQLAFPDVELVPFRNRRATGRFWVAKHVGRRIDAYCLGGGTLINSPAPLQSSMTMRKLGLRGFTFGTGVRASYYWDHVKDFPKEMPIWAEHLKDFSFLTVRGPQSKELLAEVGVTNVEIIGDPALQFWRPSRSPRPATKRIGVNVGKNLGRVWGGDEDKVIDEIFRCSQRLAREGYDITVLTVSATDHPIGAELAKNLGGRTRHEAITENVSRYLDVCEGLDLVIAYKLHAGVLAMCRSVPVVSVEYEPKCLDFMRSMGQEAHNLRADQATAESIYQRSIGALSARVEIAASIDLIAEDLVARQCDFARRVTSALAFR